MNTITTDEAVLRKRLFTVDEYHSMGKVGILGTDERVELVEGEVFEMAPIGVMHAFNVDILVDLLSRLLHHKAWLRVQNPLQLAVNVERYPDIALVKLPKDRYKHRTPQGGDVLLVIEVADTTLISDREVKIPEYAYGGVPEVWLIDLNRKKLEVYRTLEDGRYTSITTLGLNDQVTAEMVSLTVQVSEIIPD